MEKRCAPLPPDMPLTEHLDCAAFLAGSSGQSRKPRSRTNTGERLVLRLDLYQRRIGMISIRSLPWRSLRSVSPASIVRAKSQASLGRASLCTSTDSSSSPSGRPLRVCVVGSGPAGFYVTKYLLKEEAELGCKVAVDIVDKLPTPYGLVRFGVAPDHPEVKAVQNDFEQVASDPRVSFFGNVCFGRDISAKELSELYDVVVLAYGAGGDRELTVPGADLNGVFAARAFVSWYNGHPEFAHMSEDFGKALASSDTVAIVGVGNVALDCARILAKVFPREASPFMAMLESFQCAISTGAENLRETDICEHTLDVLSSAGTGLRRVVILGRRGHVQASFTIKELRELTKLDGVACLVRQEELELGRTPASLDELKTTRAKTRIDALLAKIAGESRDVSADAKAVELRFLVGLSEILPSDDTSTRVGAVRVERNRLEVDQTSGAQHAVGSDETDEIIDCGMVLGSIGYRCLPVEGVPYDEQNSIIANDRGRVPGMPGMYCSGWARRGPSGIIGTNIADARSVVAAIVEDISSKQSASDGKAHDRQSLASVLKNGHGSAPGLRGSAIAEEADMKRVQIVDWEGYQRIDRDEMERGAVKGKPREKIVDVGQMLTIARIVRDE